MPNQNPTCRPLSANNDSRLEQLPMVSCLFLDVKKDTGQAVRSRSTDCVVSLVSAMLDGFRSCAK